MAFYFSLNPKENKYYKHVMIGSDCRHKITINDV